MPTPSEPYSLQLDEWVLRVQPPVAADNPRLLLLIHGWTGDENVMWVFTRRFPADYWILAPRAPVAAPGGGYGWHPHTSGIRTGIDDFKPAVEGLMRLIDRWSASQNVDASTFSLIGFSQGTALCYALALLHPARVEKLAGLAGFLPAGAETLAKPGLLEGKPIYVAHGSQDDTVPVERARQAVETLERAGAKVTYCEDQVGHKLGANCLRGLESFYR